jgi:predicted amidophosphoribosyltransferase
MATGCLYCGLQLPDTTEFCPLCGRPIEKGFEIRPIQVSEFDRLRATGAIHQLATSTQRIALTLLFSSLGAGKAGN